MPIGLLGGILAAGSIGSSIAGSVMSANAQNKSGLVGPIPAPQPINPQLTSLYQGIVGGGNAQAASGTLNQAITTGLPTDVGPAFEALKAAGQRGFAESKANLLESFGAGGLRFGSPAMQATVDLEAQNQANLLQTLSQYTMQAQEAAANRRVAASEFAVSSLGDVANSYYNQYVPKVGYASPAGAGLSAGSQGLSSILSLIQMMKLFGGG